MTITLALKRLALPFLMAALGAAVMAALPASIDAAVSDGDTFLEDGGGGGWEGGGGGGGAGGGGGGGGAPAECADGIDNDANGLIDLNDLGCTSSGDTTESGYTPPKQCNDGLDNDANGFIDYSNDPGCSSVTDNAESGYNTQCSDNIDNDGNGKKDYPADYACSSLTDTTEQGWIPPSTPSSGLQVYKTQSKRDYYVKTYPDMYTNGGLSEYTAAHGNWPAASLSGATISDTGRRICYLYDPTATITEWTLGGFDSPGNNSMAAWDKSSGRWRAASASAFGNQRYNWLTCKTWAPPDVTLTVSDSEITQGESITLTWGSAYQRQGTFTPYNFSNTIFIPGHNETVTNYVCANGGGGGDGGSEQVYMVSVPKKSLLAASGSGCWWETTTTWVPDQTVTTVSGSRTLSPTRTTTYSYRGTNVNGSWTESVTVTVNPGAVSAECTGSPTTVNPGDTVTWTATDLACGPEEMFYNPTCNPTQEQSYIKCPAGQYVQLTDTMCEPYPGNAPWKQSAACVDCTQYSYAWSGTGGLTGNTASVTHTYTTSGNHTASVTMTNGGQSSQINCTTTVTVANECSDGRDNNGNNLIDSAEPNCHTDGNPSNPTSHQPTHNDESTPIAVAPTVTLFASPTTIVAQQSAVLTWSSSSGTDTCTSSDFTTGGAANRSSPGVTVTPASTKTYNITCTDTTPNPDLSGYGSATVTVVSAPTLAITANGRTNPSPIRSGEYATIAWNGGSSDSCSVIGPGLSRSTISDSASVQITGQSTYTLSCRRLDTYYQQSVTVRLLPASDEE